MKDHIIVAMVEKLLAILYYILCIMQEIKKLKEKNLKDMPPIARNRYGGLGYGKVKTKI